MKENSPYLMLILMRHSLAFDLRLSLRVISNPISHLIIHLMSTNRKKKERNPLIPLFSNLGLVSRIIKCSWRSSIGRLGGIVTNHLT